MTPFTDYPNGRAALSTFMSDLRDDVIGRIDSGKYNATGRLRRSVAVEVASGFATEGTMYALSTWKFLGNGRGPGKKPPIAPLVEWAKAKGLAKTDSEARSFAYRIASSMSKRGSLDHQLGGKNQFAEAIRSFQPRIDSVMQAFLKDADEPIARQFNAAFTKAA